MSKFKITLKLTGLELQIEGSRDDVPLMAKAAGQQLAGMFAPAAGVIEGEIVSHNSNRLPALAIEPGRKTKRRSSARQKHRATVAPKSNGVAKDEAIDWKHDPSKWGTPQPQWSTADKAMWLLYVAARETGQSDLTSRAIAMTFKKHFHQAGIILVNNINRDLGRLKSKSPALVSEDTTKSPPTWFLTPVGERRTEELVAQALGRTSDTENPSGG